MTVITTEGINFMAEEYLGEELYNLLAELLNRKLNRTVLDSIRGEYGVLRYLLYVKDKVSAGVLTGQLHVVPGKMRRTGGG